MRGVRFAGEGPGGPEGLPPKAFGARTSHEFLQYSQAVEPTRSLASSSLPCLGTRAGRGDHVGHELRRSTVQRILSEHGIEPSLERKGSMPWETFLKARWEVIAAADFFTVEVPTARGLVREAGMQSRRWGGLLGWDVGYGLIGAAGLST